MQSLVHVHTMFCLPNFREENLSMLYKEGSNYTIYLNSDGSEIRCVLAMTYDSSDPFIRKCCIELRLNRNENTNTELTIQSNRAQYSIVRP